MGDYNTVSDVMLISQLDTVILEQKNKAANRSVSTRFVIINSKTQF